MAAASGAAPAEDEPPLASWATLDFGGGLREVTVAKAVEEYLSYHHLEEALAAFREDLERAQLTSKPSRASAGATQDVVDVLADFDAGRQAAFDAAWERIMPPEFRGGRNGRSLELRLRAHFALFRARQWLQSGGEPPEEELQSDLEPFRAFLSAHGLDEVCGDEAMMPLLALPFVRRPYAQPNLKELFAPRWLQELRGDIEAALHTRHPRIPALYDALEPSSSGGSDDAAWQSVWAELFRVADAGLDAAGALASGPAPIGEEWLAGGSRQLERLREKVPGGFELRLRTHIGGGSRGGEGGPVSSPPRSVRSRAATGPPALRCDLDFSRIAEFIVGGPDAAGSPSPPLPAVLRSLLQRLASAESRVSQRRGFLVSVACFDVLGVHSHPQTLPALLSQPEVAELTLGILAVLACEAVGRSYIVANIACVEKVVQVIKAQTLESSLHIQALAALQRLSLRRAPQDLMIKLGMMEWIVGVLGWHGDAIQGMPTEFTLEFASAMLMNLAVRSAGKRKCLELDTLTVALNLMEHWNPQIRTHINGTLYSLLSVPEFRARARRAGLEGILRSIHAQAASLGDDLSTRQIEYLLEQLNPSPEVETDGGGDSGEDDEDDDENFLEEEELAGLLLGDRCGLSAEEALRSFTATPAVVESQAQQLRSFLRQAGAQ